MHCPRGEEIHVASEVVWKWTVLKLLNGGMHKISPASEELNRNSVDT